MEGEGGREDASVQGKVLHSAERGELLIEESEVFEWLRASEEGRDRPHIALMD